MDGTKRLAWLSTKVLLVLNGQRIEATADEGERFMLDLVAGHADLPVTQTGYEITPPMPLLQTCPTSQLDANPARLTPVTPPAAEPQSTITPLASDQYRFQIPRLTTVAAILTTSPTCEQSIREAE